MLEARSQPVVALTDTELKALQGVGKAIFSKIREYEQRGSFNLLERVRSVPEGLRALLRQGLPPAAVRALEAEGITSPAALLTAHGQGNGAVARSANYAIVPGIQGVRQGSQLLYIIDDRTQAVYVLETAGRSNPSESVIRRGWYDLRSMAELMQAKRQKTQASARKP